ncbi:UPF0061-domain-containing protein [Thelephora ganbajun]|uniref:UPF0061-domain-containing protein n=1 Tax=Thelephora ganbajun TaxID=370292 RepID=A0ACB6Z6G0_THEGA|nr:UPF0061-domain-containing protein [Thelephora ganbajun]
MSSTATTKKPISALPLPPEHLLFTKNLTPDAEIPNPVRFLEILKEKPSIQRRSRAISAQSHFSFTSPLPVHFPYRLQPPDPSPTDEERLNYIERKLAELEPLEERLLPPAAGGSHYKKFASSNRDPEQVLVGLSEAGLRDCVPGLDVGDAFSVIGKPSLLPPEEVNGSREATEEEIAARQELIDILSGRSMIVPFDENGKPVSAPWSLRYSGHQFGVWAGQLGDGRAISVLTTPHPNDPELVTEIQLKGAGRTPYSRNADGLAVTRSSIREFLAAEAMHALGIPTSRSLTLISLPGIEVWRERVETACIAARMAPSFLRVGSFEALNPPTNMFFIGGYQQLSHWEGLRVLGEWAGRRVLRLEGVKWEGENKTVWGKKLVLETAKRNAKMVAGWQVYGFMHGVINTDNVSILGLTIDYGPYAFMDVFDSWHVCNHTDEEGRYSYKRQPEMVFYAVQALLRSVAPIIAAEEELGGKAISEGWANVDEKKLEQWSKAGQESVRSEVKQVWDDTYDEEYARLFRRRLGLRKGLKSDETGIFKRFLDLMEEHNLDFHSTFRKLSAFRSSYIQGDDEKLNVFISHLLESTPRPGKLDQEKASADFKAWLTKYSHRIFEEREEWSNNSQEEIDALRAKEMNGVNPRFVLRQWVLEEAIARVEKDAVSGRRILAKMATNPYEPWGAEGVDEEVCTSGEVREERKYCGLGEEKMLGFQCSCSS